MTRHLLSVNSDLSLCDKSEFESGVWRVKSGVEDSGWRIFQKPSPLGEGGFGGKRLRFSSKTNEVVLIRESTKMRDAAGGSTSSDPAKAGPPSPEGEGLLPRGSHYSFSLFPLPFSLISDKSEFLTFHYTAPLKSAQGAGAERMVLNCDEKCAKGGEMSRFLPQLIKGVWYNVTEIKQTKAVFGDDCIIPARLSIIGCERKNGGHRPPMEAP